MTTHTSRIDAAEDEPSDQAVLGLTASKMQLFEGPFRLKIPHEEYSSLGQQAASEFLTACATCEGMQPNENSEQVH